MWQLNYLIIFSIFFIIMIGGKVICVINSILLLSILLLLSWFHYIIHQYKEFHILYDRVLNNNKTMAEDKAILRM